VAQIEVIVVSMNIDNNVFKFHLSMGEDIIGLEEQQRHFRQMLHAKGVLYKNNIC
jgi:hypothetical protein